MNPRVSELINLFDMEPHVGGGYIREVFRSTNLIHLPGNKKDRRALTTIYYLLGAGEYDCWHRVDADEVWHYHEGAPLDLLWVEKGEEKCNLNILGGIENGSKPIAVVPGGCWQMARTKGEYTLVGCTMGPGFEYECYQLLRDHPEEAGKIQRQFPELAKFI
jgi:predicted cupin superfamily sugar epimerase